MKKSPSILSFVLPLVVFVLISSCKKKEEEIVPLPLARQFQLQYTEPNTENISFATLNEAENTYVYNWAEAKTKADRVHFGFIAAPFPGLISPEDGQAGFFYSGVNGVTAWNVNVLAGITFDGGVAPNVNFDALSQNDIDKNVPNDGFGGDDKTGVSVQDGQILRFIQKDVNNVTRYKGYLKVVSTDVINVPRSAVIQVKYIKK